MVEACRALRREPPPGAGGSYAPPPTSLVWSSLTGELEVAGAQSPWPEGERRRLTIRLKNRSAARWLAGETADGGVALQVQVHAGGRDLRAADDWIVLPFDLAPGDEQRFEVAVRRPPGPARLRVLPHVLGHGSFEELGGPVWEGEI